jgi:hypothetical protein
MNRFDMDPLLNECDAESIQLAWGNPNPRAFVVGTTLRKDVNCNGLKEI